MNLNAKFLMLACTLLVGCGTTASRVELTPVDTPAFSLGAQHSALRTCAASVSVPELEFHLQASVLRLESLRLEPARGFSEFAQGLQLNPGLTSAYRVPCDDAAAFMAKDAEILLDHWREHLHAESTF